MSPQEAIDAISHVMTSDQGARLEIAAILAQVEVTPPQGIARDALKRELKFWVTPNFIDRAADRILALARPVEGILLSPEEAATALRAVEEFRDGAEISRKDSNLMHALAARLEASQ